MPENLSGSEQDLLSSILKELTTSGASHDEIHNKVRELLRQNDANTPLFEVDISDLKIVSHPTKKVYFQNIGELLLPLNPYYIDAAHEWSCKKDRLRILRGLFSLDIDFSEIKKLNILDSSEKYSRSKGISCNVRQSTKDQIVKLKEKPLCEYEGDSITILSKGHEECSYTFWIFAMQCFRSGVRLKP